MSELEEKLKANDVVKEQIKKNLLQQCACFPDQHLRRAGSDVRMACDSRRHIRTRVVQGRGRKGESCCKGREPVARHDDGVPDPQDGGADGRLLPHLMGRGR